MMLKELTDYFSSIKKSKTEIKVIFSEIRKIDREKTVEGMNPRIKSMI